MRVGEMRCISEKNPNSFTGQGVLSQTPNNACKKGFLALLLLISSDSEKRKCWLSSTLKTVDLDYRSSLSVAQLVRF